MVEKKVKTYMETKLKKSVTDVVSLFKSLGSSSSEPFIPQTGVEKRLG